MMNNSFHHRGRRYSFSFPKRLFESADPKSLLTLLDLPFYFSIDDQLHFVRFETKELPSAVNWLRRYASTFHLNPLIIFATGGGSYKHANTIREQLLQGKNPLRVEMHWMDEMSSLVLGTSFLIRAVPREAFRYSLKERVRVPLIQEPERPYLLVNIGSGVSILRFVVSSSFLPRTCTLNIHPSINCCS